MDDETFKGSLGKLYFDHDGKPVESMEQLAELHLPENSFIRQDTLPDGKWISTVWIGTNMAHWKSSRPLIFETIVFRSRSILESLDGYRYETKEEAIKGHERMLKIWTNHKAKSLKKLKEIEHKPE